MEDEEKPYEGLRSGRSYCGSGYSKLWEWPYPEYQQYVEHDVEYEAAGVEQEWSLAVTRGIEHGGKHRGSIREHHGKADYHEIYPSLHYYLRVAESEISDDLLIEDHYEYGERPCYEGVEPHRGLSVLTRHVKILSPHGLGYSYLRTYPCYRR